MNKPTLARLFKEQKENQAANEFFLLRPVKNGVTEWHFTLRGPTGSVYEHGYYHGCLLLPPCYPFGPPDIVFFTRTGRFRINKKICLSITSYHKQEWSPAWTLSGIIRALISQLTGTPIYLSPGSFAESLKSIDPKTWFGSALVLRFKFGFVCVLLGAFIQMVDSISASSLSDYITEFVNKKWRTTPSAVCKKARLFGNCWRGIAWNISALTAGRFCHWPRESGWPSKLASVLIKSLISRCFPF